MREDLAIAAAAAGDVVLWGDKRLLTTLSFIYLPSARTSPSCARCATSWRASGRRAEQTEAA